MNKYRAMLITANPDDVAYVFDCEGETVQDVWDKVNNLGSKWFFYPIPIVVTNNPWQNFRYSRVIDTCMGLEAFRGKTIRSLLSYMAKNDVSCLLS